MDKPRSILMAFTLCYVHYMYTCMYVYSSMYRYNVLRAIHNYGYLTENSHTILQITSCMLI